MKSEDTGHLLNTKFDFFKNRNISKTFDGCSWNQEYDLLAGSPPGYRDFTTANTKRGALTID